MGWGDCCNEQPKETTSVQRQRKETPIVVTYCKSIKFFKEIAKQFKDDKPKGITLKKVMIQSSL